MFALPDSWVWDFWLADDGEQYHLFFLYASRALHDPDARHHRASIGHAVSDDLQEWTRVADALVRGDSPAFDDLATWTGSVVRHPDGTWFMFYTGTSLTPDGNLQRVGYATSTDLMEWQKSPENPVAQADPRWYETLGSGERREECFRDPWVFADPAGNGWHMLVTARANAGPADDRGVVGHAWSPDLRNWGVRPPLSEPGQGFGHLEVFQVEVVDGRAVLLFSCAATDVAESRRATTGATGGIWASVAASVLGPYELAASRLVSDESLYVGRLLRKRGDGDWVMFAFHNIAADGSFGGTISDPMPVRWEGHEFHLVTEAISSRA